MDTRNSPSSEFSSAESAAISAPPAWPSPRYGWYVVVVLTAIYVMAYVDRVVLGLLTEELRRAFNATDTQISLLGGAAFAVFYVTMGLPLGRLADKANRRNMIAVSTLLWSVMTCACGLTTSYWKLFLARVGVGVGEAALTPAAQSIIADYFPPAKRNAALAAYMSAVAIGSGLAYVAGGALIEWARSWDGRALPFLGLLEPWQVVFVVVGLPAIFLAPLMATVREPRRRGRLQADETALLPIREVIRFVAQTNGRTFVPIFLGFAGLALHSVALQLWLPAFFIRTFGWTEGRIGLAYGLIILTFATLGMLVGGRVAQRMVRTGRRPDALVRLPIWTSLILTPLAILTTLLPTAYATLILLGPVTALSFSVFGVIPGILQAITPNEMRGQVTSLFAFVNNMIGLALGGTLVAILTDYVFRDPGKLGWSLALTAAVILPGSALCLIASLRPFRASLERARAWEGSE